MSLTYWRRRAGMAEEATSHGHVRSNNERTGRAMGAPSEPTAFSSATAVSPGNTGACLIGGSAGNARTAAENATLPMWTSRGCPLCQAILARFPRCRDLDPVASTTTISSTTAPLIPSSAPLRVLEPRFLPPRKVILRSPNRRQGRQVPPYHDGVWLQNPPDSPCTAGYFCSD
jgi:hypothetical protein